MKSIMRWLRRLGLGGGIAIFLGYVLFCANYLPSQIKVHVTGTEVTRKDVEKPDGTRQNLDVRYVMAEGLDGRPHMFRNQDTGWGWPPYFKFDSGDVAAQAKNYSIIDPEAVVLVKYYGFRIRILSTFPNIISMRTVAVDYQPIPWFSIFFIVTHFVLLGVGAALLRDFNASRKGA